jgi:3-hydroxybutyrate dehydrogenase
MLTIEAPQDTAHDTPAATSARADSRPLRGRLALVTGSTSGIGLGIAGALAAAGAGVVLNGFGEADAIARLVSELADGHDVEVTHAHADLSSSAEIDALIGRVTARRGAIDILVNNAGIQHVAPIAEFPPERWEAVLAINLTAAFLLTRHVFAPMTAQGYGRIVNISWAHGLIASPFKAAYVTAKHGLIGLTRVTALEGAEHGVTANAICPGYVWTPLIEKQI